MEYKHRRGDGVEALCDNMCCNLPCDMLKLDGPQPRQLNSALTPLEYNRNALSGEKACWNFTSAP